MRFANKLQFGPKTHEVSMTALRIVQRMKKDSLHSGRRPTGLCGAALLIAARMHEFSRTILDIVRIVKIHESTVRKRLSEFAETPSSALTLDEFMSVDLEAEQDPPAFKAARKKDRDRIKDIGEHELTELQKQIDMHLENDLKRVNVGNLKRFCDLGASQTDDGDMEDLDAVHFIENSSIEAIKQCLSDTPDLAVEKTRFEGLKPDLESLCRPTPSELEEVEKAKEQKPTECDLDLEDLDDEEINNYILTRAEAETKNQLWKELNAEYLREVKEREERLAKEREEGKPEKKKRRPRKKPIGPSTTAGEAIEKMLQEKKISNKINYDILRTLTEGGAGVGESSGSNSETKNITEAEIAIEDAAKVEPVDSNKRKQTRGKPEYSVGGRAPKAQKRELGLPVGTEETPNSSEEAPVAENDETADETENEVEPEAEPEYSSLKDMLNDGEEDDYYGYEEDNY